MVSNTRLVWLRNDLRLIDNPALSHACRDDAAVVAVVTLTPDSWDAHDESPRRLGLWRDRLAVIIDALQALNIPMRILSLRQFDDCPAAMERLAVDLNATELCFNYEYPLNERRRDREVCERLEARNITCRGFHGDLVIPPGQVVTGQGTPFKVYTPFSNAWRRLLPHWDSPVLPIPAPRSVWPQGVQSDPLPSDLGWQSLEYPTALWPVDEAVISARLRRFIHECEPDYARWRDFPQRDATSRLSPYLSIGALSPRQCLAALRVADNGDWLHGSWLNELIWREFYRHQLVAFPDLSRLEPFRPEVEARIRWREADELFEAWCRAETGFPIVDAAMRQLLDTGWMHNRLRMVVASFLTKLLGVDWRRGERFFMRQLIDGDFASNLGGWQWSASVGADAAPYFRIFNPQAQGERFDPDGAFVAHWLPELRDVAAKRRHQPGAAGREPIIDYKQARARALAEYNGGS